MLPTSQYLTGSGAALGGLVLVPEEGDTGLVAVGKPAGPDCILEVAAG